MIRWSWTLRRNGSWLMAMDVPVGFTPECALLRCQSSRSDNPFWTPRFYNFALVRSPQLFVGTLHLSPASPQPYKSYEVSFIILILSIYCTLSVLELSYLPHHSSMADGWPIKEKCDEFYNNTTSSDPLLFTKIG
nr:hypothetical protein Itr_chr03CG20520 [Ipomoea trifida]